MSSRTPLTGSAARAREERHVDCDWVLPELALGGRLGEASPEWLAESLGIRRVVDVRSEACDDIGGLREQGIVHLHLPTPDHHPLTQAMLWTGVRWVVQGLRRGHRTLIHCEHGIGRSTLLTCCVLVDLGHDPREAMRIAKAARWKVSPSPAQLHALLAWACEWCEQARRARPEATWDELAAIAYAHAPESEEGSSAA